MVRTATLSLFFALSITAMVLSSCGSNSVEIGTASTLEASEPCIGCHGTAISPGTGAVIADEWKLSAHNTKNGAGCGDCHEPEAGHPNSCWGCHGGTPAAASTRHDVTLNPDTTQKCTKCHTRKTLAAHFGNMTASSGNTTYRASYVSSQYTGNCRKCHNPHDPTTHMPINRQWADSGHGDTNTKARTAYDFKTRGTYQAVNTTFENYCVRCHTTTGYVNYVVSGFTDQRPFAGGGQPVVSYPAVSADKTKEVTACDACHDDGNGRAYGFKLRAVPQVRVYYNYSAPGTNPTVKISDAPVDYPDAGPSNICIPCHTGRGIGPLLKLAATMGFNFRNGPRISAHDFTGAATLFKKSGYEYDGRDYSNPAAFLHERIGINGTNGTGTLGPCIACHMEGDASHSFLPVQFAPATGLIGSITSRICAKCHNGTTMPPLTPQGLQAQRFGMHAALAALGNLLAAKGVKSTTRNWEALYGAGTGPNTMGSYFNYDLLKNDWGAYVHNGVYAKRLIYDAIDWLFDGRLDVTTNGGGYVTDVEAAVNGLTFAAGTADPVTGMPYSPAELAGLKGAAVAYLLGGPGGGRP